MSDQLDLDELERVADAAIRRDSITQHPRNVKRLIARLRGLDGLIMIDRDLRQELQERVAELENAVIAREMSKDELKALMPGTRQERQDLKDERDQLKARVAELEQGDELLTQLLSERDHNLFDLEAKTAQVEAWESGWETMCRELGFMNESPEHGDGFEVPGLRELADQLVGHQGYLENRHGELESQVEAWREAAQSYGTKQMAFLEKARALDNATKASKPSTTSAGSATEGGES